MRRLFTIPDKKPPNAQFPVTLNLAGYLGVDTIGTVSYDAIDMTNQVNAGTSILDISKSLNGTSIVKPWIKGGTPGNTYKVLVDVILTGTSQDQFGIIVNVGEL